MMDKDSVTRPGTRTFSIMKAAKQLLLLLVLRLCQSENDCFRINFHFKHYFWDETLEYANIMKKKKTIEKLKPI